MRYLLFSLAIWLFVKPTYTHVLDPSTWTMEIKPTGDTLRSSDLPRSPAADVDPSARDMIWQGIHPETPSMMGPELEGGDICTFATASFGSAGGRDVCKEETARTPNSVTEPNDNLDAERYKLVISFGVFGVVSCIGTVISTIAAFRYRKDCSTTRSDDVELGFPTSREEAMTTDARAE